MKSSAALSHLHLLAGLRLSPRIVLPEMVAVLVRALPGWRLRLVWARPSVRDAARGDGGDGWGVDGRGGDGRGGADWSARLRRSRGSRVSIDFCHGDQSRARLIARHAGGPVAAAAGGTLAQRAAILAAQGPVLAAIASGWPWAGGATSPAPFDRDADDAGTAPSVPYGLSDLHGILLCGPDGTARMAAGAGALLEAALREVGVDLCGLARGAGGGPTVAGPGAADRDGDPPSIGRPLTAITPVGQVQYIAWPVPRRGDAASDWLFVLSRRLPRIILIARVLAALALTAREREVALALYGTETLPEIGRRLGLRASTVTDHRRSLYAKLDMHSRASLRRLLDGEQARAAPDAVGVSPPDAAR